MQQALALGLTNIMAVVAPRIPYEDRATSEGDALIQPRQSRKMPAGINKRRQEQPSRELSNQRINDISRFATGTYKIKGSAIEERKPSPAVWRCHLRDRSVHC